MSRTNLELSKNALLMKTTQASSRCLFGVGLRKPTKKTLKRGMAFPGPTTNLLIRHALNPSTTLGTGLKISIKGTDRWIGIEIETGTGIGIGMEIGTAIGIETGIAIVIDNEIVETIGRTIEGMIKKTIDKTKEEIKGKKEGTGGTNGTGNRNDTGRKREANKPRDQKIQGLNTCKK